MGARPLSCVPQPRTPCAENSPTEQRYDHQRTVASSSGSGSLTHSHLHFRQISQVLLDTCHLIYVSSTIGVVLYLDEGRFAVSLDHAILGLLSEHPRTGYDLKTRCFDGPLSPFWGADQAQIYRTLDRLQKAKLVSSTRRRQSGKPDRHVYEITHVGREHLGEWLCTPAPAPPVRDAFLLQLHFGASAPDHCLIELLRARRCEHQTRLDDLRSRSVALAAERPADERVVALRQAALEGSVARERATIDWLDDCIDAITEGTLPGSDDGGIGQRHLFGS